MVSIGAVYKNRDLTKVLFNKPLYIVAGKGPEPLIVGVGSNDYTRVKTAIHIINASNHNRGYFDYNVKITGKDFNIIFKDDSTSEGNLHERSYNYLLLKGDSTQYIPHDEKITVEISIKLIVNSFFSKKYYKEYNSIITDVLWGDISDEALEHTGKF
ncbi:hypothetical protein E4T89_11370 [Jeotgalicoccus nanhaiensis]|uniref:DUF2479 domain-containing protein n=1 Tax=Jeotgalicoccus nanhaiensis TaxID=568603 RepID=A0ABR9Y0S9_9STAP|nr:hypothetical protein [Jeotgalicoccus nanhaiensis]MBF0754844.1 hypothetical protein [Jeotgalicoccus nanhaiensis]TFU60715.1 hypothetical protein E4T89_11370 [Jeotgalicoccus nanhaiensis]